MKNCLQPSIAPNGDRQTAARHWLTTPALQLSAAAHTGSALLVMLNPGSWQWALGVVMFNYLVLTAGVMRPKSRMLGPNMTRLPDTAARRREVSLTFDDGPDPKITPLVLDLLDQYGAKASFFCIASKVSAYPELAREIIGAGTARKTIRTVTLRIRLFRPWCILREIESAQSTISAVTALRRIFRAPMGFAPSLPRQPSALACAAPPTRRGFDTFASIQNRYCGNLRGLAAGDILLLHDGRPNRPNRNAQIILKFCRACLSISRHMT